MICAHWTTGGRFPGNLTVGAGAGAAVGASEEAAEAGGSGRFTSLGGGDSEPQPCRRADTNNVIDNVARVMLTPSAYLRRGERPRRGLSCFYHEGKGLATENTFSIHRLSMFQEISRPVMATLVVKASWKI